MALHRRSLFTANVRSMEDLLTILCTSELPALALSVSDNAYFCAPTAGDTGRHMFMDADQEPFQTAVFGCVLNTVVSADLICD